jgi:hypothetical protein
MKKSIENFNFIKKIKFDKKNKQYFLKQSLI